MCSSSPAPMAKATRRSRRSASSNSSKAARRRSCRCCALRCWRSAIPPTRSYCEAGKRLDRRLEELGAARLHDRVDCDVDYEEPAAGWIDGGARPDLLQELVQRREHRGERPVRLPSDPGPRQAKPASTSAIRFRRAIIENLVLTGRGSSKETRHIEVVARRVRPHLSSRATPSASCRATILALSSAVIEALALDPAAADRPSRAALRRSSKRWRPRSRSRPRRRVSCEHWAEIYAARDARAPCRARADATERAAFLHDHHVSTSSGASRCAGLDAPRSSSRGCGRCSRGSTRSPPASRRRPDEAHLTVATVRYALHGEAAHRRRFRPSRRPRRGSDGTMPVYVQSNPHFRLPADDVPILMIGAGTGVAPYRAFMQEREARGASGRSWLFFGERNFRTDFLYQTEWQACSKDGVLTRMDVAFSRDRTEQGLCPASAARAGARGVRAGSRTARISMSAATRRGSRPTSTRRLIDIVEHAGRGSAATRPRNTSARSSATAATSAMSTDVDAVRRDVTASRPQPRPVAAARQARPGRDPQGGQRPPARHDRRRACSIGSPARCRHPTPS